MIKQKRFRSNLLFRNTCLGLSIFEGIRSVMRGKPRDICDSKIQHGTRAAEPVIRDKRPDAPEVSELAFQIQGTGACSCLIRDILAPTFYLTNSANAWPAVVTIAHVVIMHKVYSTKCCSVLKLQFFMSFSKQLCSSSHADLKATTLLETQQSYVLGTSV